LQVACRWQRGQTEFILQGGLAGDERLERGVLITDDNDRRPRTTTDPGIPVASQEHSLTVGPNGPILLQDFV
jgi:hypothetical protein